MEHSMNIIDVKSEMDSLTTNLLNEYMKLEKMYIQEKTNSTAYVADINSKNSSICESIQSKNNSISSLEKEIHGFKHREQEFMLMIDNLRKQLDAKVTEETETNKFDMLRSQAKEISAKDHEIIRLTNELVKLKVLSIDQSVAEKSTETLGWSPTSSGSPQPINEPNIIVLEQENKEPEGEGSDEDELFIIKYRKKQYYRDNENKVYEILEGDEVGPQIGNWVKQESGKFKVVKG